ncbi:Glyoxalase/bleomycin resistance protein/dioxygenase [Emticicia oligotrophica DSM 17448]|uniref:Glyoxalase/bleomycin resistance protein/dioxygenase n=1 Tax=Emticicia oligotrophica (strain DSM 17448 / CIP 109782 / MTCC 6937 / GPTSA100-15) TaxID=929562 RepID=A0ABM5N582_EMTOG|nr:MULTISPECIES: VOC family protein [Emticicia]AFK04586.1 Glyoxalase/bleomycin resistance protein/dioxygenase [Emticicia oligotrophica DSM 17448]
MKKPFLGLRTSIYKVSDIYAAKMWYSQVLGISPYFDEVFYVGFNVGGYELGLQPEEENQAKGEGVSTYWGVNDVYETYQQLLNAGATMNEEPTDVGDGIVVATVKDPWNNILGIIYNPHFIV